MSSKKLGISVGNVSDVSSFTLEDMFSEDDPVFWSLSKGLDEPVSSVVA